MTREALESMDCRIHWQAVTALQATSAAIYQHVLEKDPQYLKLYREFTQEYEQLEHMREVTVENDNPKMNYFLSHHDVYRPEKSTTKTKTLGMSSDPVRDTFSFKVDVIPSVSYTKRSILSIIARLFDPLGLVGTLVSKATMLMQKLWRLSINWKDPLPNKILQKVKKPLLKKMKNRHVNVYPAWVRRAITRKDGSRTDIFYGIEVLISQPAEMTEYHWLEFICSLTSHQFYGGHSSNPASAYQLCKVSMSCSPRHPKK
ncbi:uncharacterized protein TNCV_3428431 [Trichonephila clavipes]|nr:uncharacterized protein TNCV_3428431 [Trichonephila clavipes]